VSHTDSRTDKNSAFEGS